MDEWRDVPQDRYPQWQATFQSSKEVLHVAKPCPVCGSHGLYRWFQLSVPFDEKKVEADGSEFIGRGGLWEWCRMCRAFAHYSGMVPAWWNCDLEVDEAKLTSYPTAIEEALAERA